jgi:hypothetical protein
MKKILALILVLTVVITTGCTQTLSGDFTDLRLTGVPGADGAPGAKGDKGDTGDKGEMGDRGIPGVSLGRVGGNMTRWSLPGWYTGAQISFNPVSGQLYYFPIFVSENTTYLQTAVQPGGGYGAGRWIKARIYQWGSNNLPGNAVTDNLTYNITTNGIKYDTTDVVLARGYYFVGWQANYAFTMMCPDPNTSNPPLQSCSTSAATGVNYVAMYKVTGTLTNPATAPTGYTSGECAIMMFQEY